MIEVKNLTKRYGDHLAVSNLSFTIEPGHIYGFLGPNGAGKSTTMNIMTGCLAASDGQVLIGGYDIFEEPMEAKKLIGYLPEMPPLYLDQTPREYLYFVASAKGIKKADRLDEIEKVIHETHIEEVADRLIKQLSKGYRQRVGIAQALLGNPQLIILDEPTVGLDPMQIIEIRDLIKELGQNHTVILSSHILPEVEAICEKVLIIHQGELIAFDKPENLQKTLSSGAIIELICETSADKAKDYLKNLSGIEEIEAKEESEANEEIEAKEESEKKEKTQGIKEGGESSCHLFLHVDGDSIDAICRDIFFTFAEKKVAILKMNPQKADLEDIYIELTNSDDVSSMQTNASDKTKDSTFFKKNSHSKDSSGKDAAKDPSTQGKEEA